MPNPIGARKNSQFKAISTAPSFNKTPVGSATPPLPYPTIQDLGNSVGVVPSVKFNGDPVYVLSKTTQPRGKGDSLGIAKGVKSGTVTGEIKPTRASSTVNAGGRRTVRQGDPCTMNGGNNPGVYCTTQMPSVSAPKSAAVSSAPAAQPETPREKSMLEEAMDGARSLGQKYKDNVSESLHGFAATAMDKGGTIAAVGGGTAMVGGAVALTGIGAAPGAVIAAGGGAVAAVGGGVSAVGAAAETLATGLDAAAAFATTGKLPNVAATATAYAERMVMSKVEKLTKFIPGLKGGARPGANEAKAPKVESKTAKSDGSPPNSKDSNSNSAPPKPAGDGTTVVGRGSGGSRCELVRYSKGCTTGTPHHVVPDHCFREPNKKNAPGALYSGGIAKKDGWSICVTGARKSSAIAGGDVSRGKLSMADHVRRLADHGKIHALMDASETLLGAAGNPKNTATLAQLEEAGADSVARITGCDKAKLKDDLRRKHQAEGLDADTKWRADPGGKKTPPDGSQLGLNTPRGGMGVS